jgi:deaminated glutathione amidase
MTMTGSSEITTVAAVQMNSQDDLAQNLDRVAARVREAAAAGAQLIVLPENFAFFGPDAGRADLAEELDRPAGPIASRLAHLAREHRAFVIGGGMPERSSDPARPFNTCAVFGPGGELVATYRKVHLFDVEIADGASYAESSSTMGGERPMVVVTGSLRVGLSVCYDVRFPELYRRLSDAGADMFVVPAAFTMMTGKDHWHVLLRARAIEGQAYVVAAAQWGAHPRGKRTYGKSCVIDPWGDVIAQASEGEGIVVAPVDRARLASVRRSLPALAHRRAVTAASVKASG